MLIWNTTGIPHGIYYIHIWMYLNYPRLEDVLLENATVTITMPGDVKGDFKVDIRDITLITFHFGCQEGSAGYVANYDINGDGEIDMEDIYIAIQYFRETTYYS